MQTPERSFVLRFSVCAQIPDRLLDDDDLDESAYLGEWEGVVKPELVRAVFAALRARPEWSAHVRNRGASVEDEIEIVLERAYPLHAE